MKFSAVWFLCVVFICASLAQADLQTWNCTNGSEVATDFAPTDWNYDSTAGTYNWTIAGNQFQKPGRMVMDWTTDSATDPTIKFIHEITNDTTFTWTGYLAAVTLDSDTALTTYSISDPAVTLPASGWTGTITQPLTYAGIVGGKYEYVGAIDYEGGPPIANGGQLDFSYKLSFTGATTYHAIEDITPVPEPATLFSLVAFGLGGLALRWRRKA